MSIKLIASDLDGTMLAQDDSIPLSNLKAIQSLKEKQIPFAVCTGKSYAVSKNICQQCEARYGIFGNGTQIIDLQEQKEIFHSSLSLEEISTCCQIAQKYHLHIHAYGENFILTQELQYMDLRNYTMYSTSHKPILGKYDKNSNLILSSTKDKELSFYIVKNILQYIEENQLTIFNLILSADNISENIQQELQMKTNLTIQFISKRGTYKDEILHKEYEYISIAPQNIGKGTALEMLKKYLQVETDNIMAVRR